jgi:RNA polymerase sigma-70 factor (ECF subfamily)
MAYPQLDSQSGSDWVDEAELVRRLAAFEADAWQVAFDRYFASVYRLALSRTFQASAAEDLAAEVFAEAARGIERYRYRGVPFRAWLYRIARNLIADHLKRRARQSGVPIEAVQESLVAAADDVELRTDFTRALATLPEDQRIVVVLRLVEGCSVAEVAAVLRRSNDAVKQLQRRALLALRERLSQGSTAAQ